MSAVIPGQSDKLDANRERTHAVSKDDFELVNYTSPGRLFRHHPRPLRVFASDPSVNTYANAVYTPTVYGEKQKYGCLYDNRLKRIDASCVFRGRKDLCLSKEPVVFQDESQNFAHYDNPTVYLGYITDHFGHFLLESLAKWWIINHHATGDCKFLVHIDDQHVLDRPFIRTCMSLAGIQRDQFIYFERPVKIREVIVPDASFQVRSHIYQAYRRMCARLTEVLDVGRPNQTDQPLYISRSALSGGISKFLGESKIETYLQRKGVCIFHPQNHPIQEQIRLFNQHSRIVGIAGSGMHTLIFSKLPKIILYLTPPIVNPNYFLIDRGFDSTATYLQACHVSRGLLGRITRYLANKKARRLPHLKIGGFEQYHRLNHKFIIDWFEDTGFLD